MTHLAKLESEHTELDNQIAAERKRPAIDDIKLASLKRQKLAKKDEIAAFRKTHEPERRRA